MDTGLVVFAAVMAIGVGLILFGALYDRERRQRREREISSVPERTVPGLDADAEDPAYLSEAEARRTPEDAEPDDLALAARTALRARTAAATPIRAGLVSSDFITDAESGWAVLEQPRVLVITDEVATVREILAPIEAALAVGQAIVLVAPGFADEVRRTLEVNRIRRTLRLAAVIASGDALSELASACGGRPLRRSELVAGWVPPEAIGRAGTWVSSTKQTWVLGGGE